ncbi:MAG: CBS domain-containing protein [Gemmatimonadota bacterium]
MRLSQILDSKGASVVTTGPETSLATTARLLVEHNIGAVIVVDDGDPVGIFTERDLLRFVATDNPDLERTPVSAVMTRDLVTIAPTEGVARALDLMKDNRIRHLPVMDDDTMVGIVSARDVMNALHRSTTEENAHLKTYIFAVR